MLLNSPVPRAILDLISSGSLIASPQVYEIAQQYPVSDTGVVFHWGQGKVDLNLGSKFDIQFIKMTYGSLFISRSHANTFTFSLNKLLEILTCFQVKLRSFMANAMKKILVEYEVSSMEGKGTFCATSLEYMMEFNMMCLGIRDVQASSITVNEQNDDAEMKLSYSVALTNVRVMDGEKLKHWSEMMKRRTGEDELDEEKTGTIVNAGKPGGSGIKFNVGHGGVGENDDLRNVYVGSETQVYDDPNAAFFFLEIDLNLGSKLNLQFTMTISESLFISLKLRSVTACAMKKTLVECEVSATERESKFHATLLESITKFNMMSLGTRDVVAPTGVCAMGREKLVAYHAQPYLYTVFHYQVTGKSKVYTVALKGNDGMKMDDITLFSFYMLKVKHGSSLVCHFIPENHVLWTIRK
ncbi:BURP domain-containing protein [Dioscorea alata]|uniref:BURP domain-containing protein n=1 Tax=Dioscorea alata TaxID=55571 RepID=A0ACB7UXR0_DIOAL|nr:BURP domain-containing protein [Dioscorea alata]